VAGCFEYGNDTLGSIKYWELLADELLASQSDSAPCRKLTVANKALDQSL
jgi:hypothetical protein